MAVCLAGLLGGEAMSVEPLRVGWKGLMLAWDLVGFRGMNMRWISFVSGGFAVAATLSSTACEGGCWESGGPCAGEVTVGRCTCLPPVDVGSPFQGAYF